eukprot:TRINITY_DN6932_c0_g1_i1.p1 TRINITY_DN6932_c0_g1~~TRINITY_DN6932_c0_g1_i1.p1  ORF type:complete len:562 (+),score=93.17 TRINITY_DN6932_c0_g1_i1:112-1797(+)
MTRDEDAQTRGRVRGSSNEAVRVVESGVGSSSSVSGQVKTVSADGSKTRVGAASTGSGGSEGSNLLLAAIRREVQACEERLGRRVSLLESKSEFIRDTDCNRLEKQISETDIWRSEFERRLAQFDDRLLGAQAELKLLSQRVDEASTRLSESHQKCKTTCRTRIDEFEKDESVDAPLGSDNMPVSSEILENCCSRLDIAEAQIELLLESNLGLIRQSDVDDEDAALATAALAKPPCLPMDQIEDLVMRVEHVHSRAAESEKLLTALAEKTVDRDEVRELRKNVNCLSADVSALQTTTLEFQDLRNAIKGAEVDTTDCQLYHQEKKVSSTPAEVAASRSHGERVATPALLDLEAIRGEVSLLTCFAEGTRSEVSDLSTRFAQFCRAIADWQRQLGESQQGGAVGQTLQEEIRCLSECIAEGEVAIQSLAPHLLQAVRTRAGPSCARLLATAVGNLHHVYDANGGPAIARGEHATNTESHAKAMAGGESVASNNSCAGDRTGDKYVCALQGGANAPPIVVASTGSAPKPPSPHVQERFIRGRGTSPGCWPWYTSRVPGLHTRE